MKDEGSNKGRARGEPAIEFEDHSFVFLTSKWYWNAIKVLHDRVL